MISNMPGRMVIQWIGVEFERNARRRYRNANYSESASTHPNDLSIQMMISGKDFIEQRNFKTH